ncbi:serine/threonine protein kinase with PASTA sensor(s) [Kribbella flavida DSM 17836]|uniref:non-specific serine/threonine protein kinase n=1 Tax=Kribbella flavida (strain DSM 17836 / JCM 10339 / NBRC 14399) TaxID=479435 RepID=D2Q0B8_KRIFD|nr:Stk1 family PASTA domain-containing Ser/Thr kinase [Kribbella flavida]ADB31910.1 serine/threonine protein kinase with PASTA sensor(s) [Kribbella flavida DSM 17836]
MTDDVHTQVGDRLVGRVLDRRYRVGARVAKGGMATVYEALDMRLDRVVALKVMHLGMGDDAEFGRRFVAEARAAAKLSHPNVVAVFDQGEDDGTLFLAMEYVPGRTLRDVIRQQAPLSPARALDLLTPVLSALSAAHDAGIVHRDIKPENVLISDEGTVKVADFGLARAVTTTGQTATQGLLMGTVSYLAPELVTDGSADARSDVYSAGILLYELLTGSKPHTGDTPIQVAYAHVHADVPPPSALEPGIPPYVDALVQRATARDRDLRPADARVLSRQVRRVRSALEEGLPDDPDLTGDLTVPLQAMRDESGYDDGYTRGTGYVEHRRDQYADEPASANGYHDPAYSNGYHQPARRNDTIVVPFEPGGAPPPPATRVTPQPPRKGRGLIALIAVLALAIGVGAAGWYYGIHRYTATPVLLNLTATEASAKAGEVGLRTTLANQDFSETVPRGQVMETSPAPGDRIRKDGEIGLIVSKGPERYRVPQLAGLNLEAAKRALDSIKLVTGRVTDSYSETVPAGRVITFTPKFDTVMKPGNTVNLWVSQGRRPITVPDTTGKPVKVASRTLRKAGFTVERTDEYDEKVPAGSVVSQTPSSGTLFAKDKVKLVVSKGPPLVDVPNVRRKGLAEAQKILTDAGFTVKVEQAPFHLGLNLVAGQNPAAGRKAQPGTTVVVTVV